MISMGDDYEDNSQLQSFLPFNKASEDIIMSYDNVS